MRPLNLSAPNLTGTVIHVMVTAAVGLCRAVAARRALTVDPLRALRCD